MIELLGKRLLKYLLVPVARYCFRHTLHLQDMLEVAKVVFVEQACREVELTGEKVNVSRLSVITGIHRRDVERIYKRQEVHEAPQGLLSRVLGQWQYDPRFSTKGHRPKLLSHEGEGSEFHQLVASVSSDINPGTLFFELDRRKLIVQEGNGRIRLAEHVLDVGKQRDEQSWEEGFHILSQDMNDLSDAVEANLVGCEIANLHGRTEFDCIDPDCELEIRAWLLKEGSHFHRRVCDYLSQFDREIVPKAAKPEEESAVRPLRVSVGAFSFVSQGYKGRKS